jgi:phage recombination protein Bet
MTTTDIVPMKFSKPQIEILKRTVAAGVSNEEFYFFLEVCKSRGLNPFNREIYAIPREGKMTIQLGIDGLRLLAERSGKYRGQLGPFFCGADGIWKEEWIEDGPPVAAKVGIKRPDFDQTMWAVARYKSYVQYQSDKVTPMKTWAKFPEVLLAKCAEALCIRRTYPAEVGGLYTNEEMMQADRGERAFVRPAVDAATPTEEDDADQIPTMMMLFTRWKNAEMGTESAAFYQFVSETVGTTITRENARSVQYEQRLRIGEIIDGEITKMLTKEDESGVELVGRATPAQVEHLIELHTKLNSPFDLEKLKSLSVDAAAYAIEQLMDACGEHPSSDEISRQLLAEQEA